MQKGKKQLILSVLVIIGDTLLINDQITVC